MIIALNYQHTQKLLTTLSLVDLRQRWMQDQISEMIDLPLSERIKAEQRMIDREICPNCGSSLNDIANHLEGDTLNYSCTYCKSL